MFLFSHSANTKDINDLKNQAQRDIDQMRSVDATAFQQLADEKYSIHTPMKVDENFVKTKFDSMCGQPFKIKF